MWVFCCGAQRSGSTLQYNLVADIVEQSGRGRRMEFVPPEEFSFIEKKYPNDKGYKVFKTHRLTEDIKTIIESGKGLCVYSYRDVRDVIVSFKNKGWLTEELRAIEEKCELYLEEYAQWNKVKGKFYRTRYEDFYDNLVKEVHSLCTFLDIPGSEVNAEQIAAKNDPYELKEKVQSIDDQSVQNQGSLTFHKETLLHQNHLGSITPKQYQTGLSSDQIEVIEKLAGNWLFRHGYELQWPKSNSSFLSYSQHGDDYISWQLLGYKKKGIVVEVGSFDGVHLSNSFSLAQVGWKSICVEPNPVIYAHLCKNRPDAINVNSAVVADENIKEIPFYREEIGVLSGCTFDEQDVRKRYEKRGLTYKEPEKINVPAKTLTSILKESGLQNREIDVVSIDVEGFEMEVLNGLNFEDFNINLFIIEANDEHHKQLILDYFKDHNSYLHVGDNHQNVFLVRKSRISKRNLRDLDFNNFIRARQYHPIDESLVKHSIKPYFNKTPEALAFEKAWWKIWE